MKKVLLRNTKKTNFLITGVFSYEKMTQIV